MDGPNQLIERNLIVPISNTDLLSCLTSHIYSAAVCQSEEELTCTGPVSIVIWNNRDVYYITHILNFIQNLSEMFSCTQHINSVCMCVCVSHGWRLMMLRMSTTMDRSFMETAESRALCRQVVGRRMKQGERSRTSASDPSNLMMWRHIKEKLVKSSRFSTVLLTRLLAKCNRFQRAPARKSSG